MEGNCSPLITLILSFADEPVSMTQRVHSVEGDVSFVTGGLSRSASAQLPLTRSVQFEGIDE